MYKVDAGSRTRGCDIGLLESGARLSAIFVGPRWWYEVKMGDVGV